MRPHQQQIHGDVPPRLYDPLGEHPLDVHAHQPRPRGVASPEVLKVPPGVVRALYGRHALEGARLPGGHGAVGVGQLGFEVLRRCSVILFVGLSEKC